MEAQAEKRKKSLLVVVTAPSGAGKSTLCRMLLTEFPEFIYSVSCTTRAPRGGEEDGVAYHFLSLPEFETRVDRGEFLEHALVHGHRYGTLRKTVEDTMAAGNSVLMDIDVCGAAQVRDFVSGLSSEDPVRAGFVDVFIDVPSIEVLRERLVRRGEDTPETIERRLTNARGEIARAGEFRHRVVNDDLAVAFNEFRQIILDAFSRVEGVA
ncbi:MAG: guanylate kinase [Kiritimatiellia bacterium]|jgi:guanylate kinase